MDNLLSILTFIPLLAAVILAIFLRGDDEAAQQNAKWLGVTATGATFFVALITYLAFEPAAAGMQFVEERDLLTGFTYRLGVDGVSLPFVLGVTALMPLVIGLAWNVARDVRDFIIAMLAFETLAIGALLALDVALFILFFELAIAPLLILCARWGGTSAALTALKALFYMVPGILLISISLGVMASEAGTSDLSAFMRHNFWSASVEIFGIAVPGGMQTLLVLGVGISIATKLALWPFHGWSAETISTAPTAASIALLAIIPMLAAYGILRLPVAMLPQGVVAIAPWAMGLAVVGAIYGALVGLRQSDGKRLVAYALAGQAGLVVIGLLSVTQQGIDGAILLAMSRAFAIAGLFMVLTMLNDRMGSHAFDVFGGLRCNLKQLSFFALFFVFAALGVPGTGGFVGQLLIFVGAFGMAPWAVYGGALGIACLAVALFALHKQLMLGELIKENLKVLTDLSGRERFVCGLLALVLIVLGLAPNLLVGPASASVASVLALYGG